MTQLQQLLQILHYVNPRELWLTSLRSVGKRCEGAKSWISPFFIIPIFPTHSGWSNRWCSSKLSDISAFQKLWRDHLNLCWLGIDNDRTHIVIARLKNGSRRVYCLKIWLTSWNRWDRPTWSPLEAEEAPCRARTNVSVYSSVAAKYRKWRLKNELMF